MIIYMLEQLKIQKEIGVNPPHSPNNHNKLQQYFDSSSFLEQQQELSIFIKDLPIISLTQIRSINSLINLLIKQNELIGQKCQQQVGLLKQEYLKHEKFIKMNKQFKADKEKAEQARKEIEDKYNSLKFTSQKDMSRQEELETKERRLEAESLKNTMIIKEGVQKIGKMEELLNYLTNEDYRRMEDVLKAINFNDSNLSQSMIQFGQANKRRDKYFSKIKGIVSDFCNRLEKISKVISPALLANQIGTETASMMNLIGQICDQDKSKKKKKKTDGSERQDRSDYNIQNNLCFFEGMIQKLAQQTVNNNTTKDQIASELEEVKSSLLQTKQYYEGILKNLREQFQSKEDQIQRKIQLKEETIKYYEEEMEKLRESALSLREKCDSFDSEVTNLKREIEEKDFKIQNQETRFTYIQNENKQQLQRLKNETETRVQELKKMASLKLNQREQLINELSERRKKQHTQMDKEISELKSKLKSSNQAKEEHQSQLKIHLKRISNLEEEVNRMEILNRELKSESERNREKHGDWEEKYKIKTKQVEECKQAITSLDHEKSLQNAYIKQLEAKIETLNSKIKSLQSKIKTDVSNKKEITAMKNTIAEEKQRNEQYETYCAQIKEENMRLKGLVKEMKRELEEVYIRVGELKQIQGERERLFMETHKSERIRECLQKELQEMKMEMLKLETENKKMHLELKHLKNIVSRIRLLEEN